MVRNKRDYVTLMLLEKHWHPSRITLNTLLLAFKCLPGLVPPELSTRISPLRCRQSSNKLLLKQPKLLKPANPHFHAQPQEPRIKCSLQGFISII